MGLVWTGLSGVSWGFTEFVSRRKGLDRHLKTARRREPPATRIPRSAWRARGANQQEALEGPVLDLAYIGLTIVVFAALFLLIKGVERFER